MLKILQRYLDFNYAKIGDLFIFYVIDLFRK